MMRINIRQPLVHQLPLHYVLVVPVLLSVLAVVTFTVHGDVNAPLLYSECHSRATLPEISRIPVLGAPACFLVSIIMYLTASMRGIAQVSVFLAFLGALLTACRVEAARACNQRSWTIRSPTPSWLVFNLVGGTFVWDLWIVPAFLKRAKDIRGEGDKQGVLEDGQASPGLFEDEDRVMMERSFATRAEVYAIPVAVSIGFMLPAILMLVFKNVPAIIVWLFFPLWVAIVHRVVPASVTIVYALPFLAGLLTHALFIWNLFCKDDSRTMTRMALKFMKIDFIYIVATVLYWVFAEASIVPTVLMVVFSVFLGPGAALCLTWLVRERAISSFAVSGDENESDEESDGDDSTVHEDTPLLP